MGAMSIYHYTCAHQAAKMMPDAYGNVTLEPRSPGGLLWLTDLATPVRQALGLTSMILDCDRTEYRLELLDLSTVRRWVDVRRSYRELWALERVPGVMPMHWYVSTSPERARLSAHWPPSPSVPTHDLAASGPRPGTTGGQPHHYAP